MCENHVNKMFVKVNKKNCVYFQPIIVVVVPHFILLLRATFNDHFFFALVLGHSTYLQYTSWLGQSMRWHFLLQYIAVLQLTQNLLQLLPHASFQHILMVFRLCGISISLLNYCLLNYCTLFLEWIFLPRIVMLWSHSRYPLSFHPPYPHYSISTTL